MEGSVLSLSTSRSWPLLLQAPAVQGQSRRGGGEQGAQLKAPNEDYPSL